MPPARRFDDASVIRLLSRRMNMEEGAVRSFIDALADAILAALAAQPNVHLKDFVGFSVHETKARRIKTPKGGVSIVPPSRHVTATAEKGFQEKAKRRLETILVLDAGSDLVKTAVRYLTLASFTVVETASPDAARSILTTRPVSLLLVDGRLSPVETAAVCRYVREHPTGGPTAIVVAGRSGAPLPEERFRVLPNAWIEETETPEGLFARVESEMARLVDERGYFQKQAAFDLPSAPDDVREALAFLEHLLQRLSLAEDQRFNLVTAFREALENGLRHGNQGDPAKRLHGEILVDLEKVTFSVRDEGPGFDYEAFLKKDAESDTLNLARENIAQGKTGGLGIKLLQECVDEIQYLPPGNTLVLTKRLTPGGASSAEPTSASAS